MTSQPVINVTLFPRPLGGTNIRSLVVCKLQTSLASRRRPRVLIEIEWNFCVSMYVAGNEAFINFPEGILGARRRSKTISQQMADRSPFPDGAATIE